MGSLLRIAFPKFERSAEIEQWFIQAGLPIYDIGRPGLHMAGDPWDCGMNIECFSVSHVDVGTYVERGVAQIGFMESDKIAQTRCKVWSPYTLPFGRYPVVFAAPRSVNLARLTAKPVLRLATPLADMAHDWFTERGILIEIVPVNDSPDAAVLLGLADAFVSVLDARHDLERQGFHVLDILGYVELKMIVNNACCENRRLAVQKIIRVLKKIPVVEESKVYIPFDES